VIRTRVGYAGGTKENPTYHSLGNHTETVQIDYDPDQITFKELLEVFWESHRPTVQSWSRQYMAAVFFHNDEQKRLAMETRDRVAAKAKGKIHTQILPATKFYLAEAYHQKYRLRHEGDLMREFSTIYPATEDFVNSTAAARVNGYLSGYGTFTELQEEVDGFGLSPTRAETLLDIVYRLSH